jgi:cardiolipin-specific phospholipase
MIKTSSLAFSALPSRLTLATSTSLVNNSPAGVKMTTDATAASPSSSSHSIRGQQPMLASQRAKQRTTNDTDAEMAESENKSRSRRSIMNAYFPLGYKDAVHQWVGTSLLTNTPHELC